MPAKILEVPEFNKKEVEKISLDRVKQAIADGEIEVGGGTQLYHHYIHDAGELYFIDIITHIRSFDELFPVNTSIYFANDYICARGWDDDISDIYPQKITHNIGTDTFELMDFNNRIYHLVITDFVDTVTKL